MIVQIRASIELVSVNVGWVLEFHRMSGSAQCHTLCVLWLTNSSGAAVSQTNSPDFALEAHRYLNT